MKILTTLKTGSVLAILLTLLFVAGCQGGVKGSGKLQTENYDYSDFTHVYVSNAFTIDVVQSSSYSIEVTVDDNLLEYIDISREGGTLKIGLTKVTLLWPITLEAKINMPDLRGLVLSEATRSTVSGFSATKNLDIELLGASSLDLVDMSVGVIKFNVYGASKVAGNIIADDAEFNVDGVSTVQLEGSADNMAVEATGSSRVELAGLTAGNVDIKLSGASIGAVNVDGRLDADLSDASTLSYIGEPTMGAINTAGASTLRWK
ncbi:GIN domain-containing protein [Chloroflexota bacterium]